jgi:hypothetical protein
MKEFTFQPRWKEELVVTGNGGEFILELPMGVLTAYLPTESTWKTKSPEWAKNLYSELEKELRLWCVENKANLIIDETAGVGINDKWS